MSSKPNNSDNSKNNQGDQQNSCNSNTVKGNIRNCQYSTKKDYTSEMVKSYNNLYCKKGADLSVGVL